MLDYGSGGLVQCLQVSAFGLDERQFKTKSEVRMTIHHVWSMPHLTLEHAPSDPAACPI